MSSGPEIQQVCSGFLRTEKTRYKNIKQSDMDGRCPASYLIRKAPFMGAFLIISDTRDTGCDKYRLIRNISYAPVAVLIIHVLLSSYQNRKDLPVRLIVACSIIGSESWRNASKKSG